MWSHRAGGGFGGRFRGPNPVGGPLGAASCRSGRDSTTRADGARPGCPPSGRAGRWHAGPGRHDAGHALSRCRPGTRHRGQRGALLSPRAAPMRQEGPHGCPRKPDGSGARDWVGPPMWACAADAFSSRRCGTAGCWHKRLPQFNSVSLTYPVGIDGRRPRQRGVLLHPGAFSHA